MHAFHGPSLAQPFASPNLHSTLGPTHGREHPFLRQRPKVKRSQAPEWRGGFGSLDATGTVATIYADLLAGQCLRPQRLAGGLDTSRVVATLHPVISIRCTLCGCGIRPPCASPTDLSHASLRSAAPRTAHDASRSRVEGEGSLPLT